MRNSLLLLALLPLMVKAQINNFQWPMAPVDQQHRISATFDECRENRDHFHNGTDMPLAPGGQALSIMAGQVTGKGSDWIRVEDFAYVHVVPNAALDVGETVSKGAVVGLTDSYAHIHLNYGGGASGHPTGNPLLPGKITPFQDPYHPRSPIIQLVKDGTTSAYSGNTISGRVDIIAQAADTTDLQSSIDMNNGIYKIGWALYSADKRTVLEGPYFWFEAKQLYSNSDINTVYAPGSTTSIYKYIVTNKITSNGYLDCSLYSPGDYVLAVMSCDTRDNWDTTYVPVVISEHDLLPPAAPKLNYVGPDANGDLHFEWTPPNDEDLAGFILEYSLDGVTWNNYRGPAYLTAGMSSYTVTGYSESNYKEFRLSAVDNAPTPNQSEYSDTYAVRLVRNSRNILIVDGFDRTTGSWNQKQHDFSTYYARAIFAADEQASIISVNNEWVIAAGDLQAYSDVIWFVGDDSRTDETFNGAEQAIIRAYLDSGGHFFASGAEIGYDLSAGSSSDKDFMNQVLRIAYAGDNSASLHVDGTGIYFSGITFNYGAQPYVEDWPDYFTTSHQGEVVLKYGNGLIAGVGYRDSSVASLVIGFTFETIDTETNRALLMERVLAYFGNISNNEQEIIPVSPYIAAIYPNPFNAMVNIKYHLDKTGTSDISIFDMRGRLIYAEQLGIQPAGTQVWRWNARNKRGESLSSGSYIVRLRLEGGKMLSGKLLLLK